MADQATIESIKTAVDIVQIIGEVVTLQKKGGNYFGVCPFHSEKTPSFSVSPQKQIFHCFGCKAGGDVFKFYQLYHRTDFPQALEELGKRAGIEVKTKNRDSTWDESLKILEESCLFFEEGLWDSSESKKFQNYLQQRKINLDLAREFRLGAHVGGFNALSERLHSKRLSRDIAVRLGILGRNKQGKFVDRFRGRLMFSIADDSGRIRGFGGRSIGDQEPKYINSPASNVFNKKALLYGMHLASQSLRRQEYVVLVEGYLDVIALHEFGIKNCVCSMGTALTQDQVRKIKRWCGRVLSLYDADQAGLQATERNLELFIAEGVEAKVAIIPEAKDPDELLHSKGLSREEAHERLKEIFKSATPALDFLVEKKVLVHKDSLKRAKAVREMFEFLDAVPEQIEREMLKKELSDRFQLGLENIELGKKQAAAAARTQRRPQTKRTLSPDPKWDKEILKFLVLWGKNADFSLTDVIAYLSFPTKWSKLLRDLANQGLSSKEVAALGWLDSQEEVLQAEIREWLLIDGEGSTQLDLSEIWVDLVKRLRNAFFKHESSRIQGQLEEAEVNGDQDSIRRLLSEKQDLVELVKSAAQSES